MKPLGRQAVDAVIARQFDGGVAGLASAAAQWWSDNQSRKKDASIQALDTVLAEYAV